ncbi:MAG: peptidylprolyl isomerase [Gammaproteobacteria bacterium]|nr:MAG: peptidylprolyl isomerase [Gammaproteobacteria bacterium]
MEIEKDKVVAFHYTLAGLDGQELESSLSSEPTVYLHGQSGMLWPVQQALLGKKAGDKVEVELTPAQAYGERKEDSITRIPIKHLTVKNKKKLRKGQIVKVNTKEGGRNVTVVKVGKFNVDVDTNHPFAGIALKYNIEIVEVRKAEPEELSHGHVHGAGGHQH